MNHKNILIFLNTPYHVETAISIYESVKQINYTPYILIDFIEDEKDNGFGLIDFFEKYNLNYLTPQQFDSIPNSDFFYKMFVVTATQNKPNLISPELLPPINYNHRMELYKDRAILIYHKADYSDYLEHVNNFFENPQWVSVVPFSQKYGLPYIFQIESPVAKVKTTFLNKKKLNFLLIGRFNLKNREINLLESLINIDNQLQKQIQIDFMGQKPIGDSPLAPLLDAQNFKNIKYRFYFDLDQIDFYEKIYNSDFILNLIGQNYYITDRFTSNLHHIIAFSKPNITPVFLNLVYNIPGLNYLKNFQEIFLEAANLEESEYIKMVNNFEITKNNMRNHNTNILNNLLN